MKREIVGQTRREEADSKSATPAGKKEADPIQWEDLLQSLRQKYFSGEAVAEAMKSWESTTAPATEANRASRLTKRGKQSGTDAKNPRVVLRVTGDEDKDAESIREFIKTLTGREPTDEEIEEVKVILSS